MKVIVLYKGRVVELPMDGVLVQDAAGATLLVAGRLDDGMCGFAHLDDPDFREIADAVGFDARTIICPEADRLVVDHDGGIRKK